jgi:hypothetical protein
MKGRGSQRFTIVAFSIIFFAQIHVCRAQSAVPASGIPPADSGRPYKANVKATWSLVLADGQSFANEASGTVSRDQQGNVREEGYLTRNGSEPVSHPVTMVHLYVVENNTELTWNSTSTNVTAIRLNERSETLFEELVQPAPFFIFRMGLYGGTGRGVERRTEPLGTKLIGGIRAEGKRFLEIAPAGEYGAKQKIVASREVWTDPETDAPLLIHSTYPGIGDFTLQISNISSGPQDESQFQTPQGYKERDITPPPGRPSVFIR